MYKFYFIKQVEPDGQCLCNATLPQFLHHKELFTADLLQKQIALHMLKHMNLFYPYVQQDLLDSGKSYESYCVNIFNGKVWGDDFLLSALGHMFHVAITLISPVFDQQLDLFHMKKVPDIMIIANGGDYIISKQPCTHFSGSKVKKGIPFNVPGSEMLNPKLKPVIYSGFQRGTDDSLKHYLQEEKDMCLLKLRAVRKDIKNLDSKVVDLIKASDKLVKKKEQIERKLEHLAVKTEDIEKAGRIKERGYVATEKKKSMDETEAAAESIAKELREQDVLNILGDLDKTSAADNPPIEIDLDPELTQVTQFTMDDQTIQPEELLGAVGGETGKALEVTAESDKQLRVNKMLLQTGMNPALLQFLPGNQEQKEQARYIVPETGTSVDPIVSQQPVTQQPVTQTSGQEIPQNVPMKQDREEKVFLVQKLNVTAPRSRTTVGPVPDALQDKEKYKYCNKCPHKYTTKAELLRHQHETCLKPRREFYCPECLKSYYSKTSIQEHYYQVHLKKSLYRCKKCGKEFANKSRRSDHNRSCPDKEKDNKFEDVQRDENIEQLFVKSVLVTGTGTSGEPLILDIENPTPLDLQPTPLQPVINPG